MSETKLKPDKFTLVSEFFRDFCEEIDVADDIDELINEYAYALIAELEA